MATPTSPRARFSRKICTSLMSRSLLQQSGSRRLPADTEGSRTTVAARTRTILSARPLMQVTVAFALLIAFGSAPTASAQDPPLSYGNNFFVTGDYVVAGAHGLDSNFDFTNCLAIGTIQVPDNNPGIKPSVISGTNSVPTGAQIVAAILYWQTVEKVGVMPGQPGSGQNGFFRPLIPGGVKAPGYPKTGVALGGSNAVSWSSGGCTTSSTGKVVRTYRTSVLGYLPIDQNGNATPMKMSHYRRKQPFDF